MIHIGLIFRKTRMKIRGLSQAEVARRAGLKREYLNRIEMGRIKHPRLDTLNRIAKGLGVPLSKVIDIWERFV